MLLFTLFAQIIIPDFQVNTEDYQGNAPQLYPVITTYDSGGVIIWYDMRQPARGMMVFGSLIDIAGDTINNNFLLNDDTTAGCMSLPQIDGDINGNFTIVYVQNQNIKARRFNKYGIPSGPSFVVNIGSNCAYPAIKIRGNRTIITWFQGGAIRIYGQVYDNSGNPIGTNFVVSDSSVVYNTISDIAIRNNGNFIVAWHFNNEIWAQKFDSLGNRIGGNYKLINDSISTSESNPKIEFHFNTEILEVLGTDFVEGLKVINNVTKEEYIMEDVKGLFVAVGHKPNTDFLEGFLELGKFGYVNVIDGTKTSKEGVFVAGDVADYRYRQAVSAAGFGCMAAIDVEKFLAQHEI
jgi:hypothetical protein